MSANDYSAVDVSVVISCYNEVENVIPIHDAIVEEFEKSLPHHSFDIIFIDNYSTDGTRDKLRLLCALDRRTKAILNSRNCGQFNSPFHALCESDGKCAIFMCCDFQDPVDLIPRLVREWEQGYKVVCAIKTASEENKVIRFFRTVYYKLIHHLSNVEQIEHFTGAGLYDRSFLDVLRELDDPQPFLRGLVAELGPATRQDIEYTQAKRRAGKTHNNFLTLYDAAMLSITSYEVVVRRCIDMNIPVVPGTATPSEVMKARNMGIMLTKFFPAGLLGGVAAMSAIAAPFTGHLFMPTGGVSSANLGEYLASPHVTCCGGTWLSRRDAIAEGRFDEISALCKEAVQLVSKARRA